MINISFCISFFSIWLASFKFTFELVFDICLFLSLGGNLLIFWLYFFIMFRASGSQFIAIKSHMLSRKLSCWFTSTKWLSSSSKQTWNLLIWLAFSPLGLFDSFSSILNPPSNRNFFQLKKVIRLYERLKRKECKRSVVQNMCNAWRREQ